MIILFEDFSINYWINNKIVDCGLSRTNQVLYINNLELPDELPDDELIFLEEHTIKTKNVDRKSKKNKSKYKFGEYKDSDFKINNIQDTSKHICIHTGVYSHNYKRKV